MPTINNLSAQIIISVALMLMGGFAMTRVTKRLGLPNVTAYILTGVLLGPMVTGFVPAEIIEGTEFVSDIALALIAFGVGEFFKVDALKKCGAGAIMITLIEAVIVSGVMFFTDLERQKQNMLPQKSCGCLPSCGTCSQVLHLHR